MKIVGDSRDVLASIDSGAIDATSTLISLSIWTTWTGCSVRHDARLEDRRRADRARAPLGEPGFWSDPTHRRAFGLYSFDYLAHSDRHHRPVPDYGNRLPLQLSDVRLVFRVDPGFGLRTMVMSQLQKTFNHSPASQEFFEAKLAQMLGCDEIRFFLTRMG